MNLQLALIMYMKDPDNHKTQAKVRSQDDGINFNSSNSCAPTNAIDEDILSTPTPISFVKTVSSNHPPLQSPSGNLVKINNSTEQHPDFYKFGRINPPLLPDLDEAVSVPVPLLPRRRKNKRAY